MKYTFSFKEVNYGSVEIEAANTPTRTEVIDAIQNGRAFYKDIEYEDIRFEGAESKTSKKERRYER